MKNPIFIHLPYTHWEKYKNKIFLNHYNIEIYIDAKSLDRIKKEEKEKFIKELKLYSINISLHGPFYDLSPGSIDEKIRKITLKRFLKSLEFAHLIGAKRLILHSGFEKHKYQERKREWVRNAILTFKEIAKLAENYKIRVGIENVFDENPEIILKIIKGVNSKYLGHCFDIGHFNIFGKCSLDFWLLKLGSFINEVHLHDNHGKVDEHLSLGKGNIDFKPLLSYIFKQKQEIILTLEIHSEEGAIESLEILKNYISYMGNSSNSL